jgi:hypothetical protein
VAEVPDFFKFYEAMQQSIPHRPKGFRIGQYVFNCLDQLRPDVADKIRTTLADPFHWSEHKWKTDQGRFWDVVIDQWERL